MAFPREQRDVSDGGKRFDRLGLVLAALPVRVVAHGVDDLFAPDAV
jgi:hypothetical protein